MDTHDMIWRTVCGALIAGAALILIAGCANGNPGEGRGLLWFYPHAAMETYGETSDEHYHRVSQILKHDARGLAEDLDLLFMTDRSSRLTRWHSR